MSVDWLDCEEHGERTKGLLKDLLELQEEGMRPELASVIRVCRSLGWDFMPVCVGGLVGGNMGL